MLERHISVRRTARYHVLGDAGAGIDDVWIVCHGFAQLAARFLRRFQTLGAPHRLIAAPEALNRFYIDTSPAPHGPDAVVGATWMTREDRENEIRDYVDYLDAVHDEILALIGHTPRHLLVLGFSQGAATVSRWVSAGRVQPDDVVIWSGGLPHDMDIAASAERWRRTRVTFVRGDRDVSLNEENINRQRDRLHVAGITSGVVTFDGGHELHIPTLQRLSLFGDLRKTGNV